MPKCHILYGEYRENKQNIKSIEKKQRRRGRNDLKLDIHQLKYVAWNKQC